MASKIKKRSGEQVDFNFDKIVTAVCSAFESCDKKCPATFKSILNQNINRFKTAATVEKIQDLIEDLLLSCGYIDIYKHFSSYRAKRLMMRELKQAEVYKSIVRTEQNDITNDNANQNAETAAGMMYKFGAEGSKAFARTYLLPAKFRDLMDEGYIHLHDFDYYAMGGLNCAQIPMDKILSGGIKSGHGSARPPQRIETASFLMMIALETTQNEMFGGQGIPAFDFYLAPFVKLTYQQEIEKIAETLQLDPEKTSYYLDAEIKEYEPNTGDDIMDLALKRTVNRVYQSLESFVHNANAIHSRGGNQTVFSSINYGTDTSPEGRCIIKQLLRTTMKGVGDGETAIFPIQIMKMKEGVNKNPGDPNYDLYEMSWKVTARRFFPNYLNLDASFYQNDNWNPDDPLRYIYEPATMGCRTSVYNDIYNDYPTTIGRGNLSFTTINLPMIALDVAIADGYLEKTKDGYEHMGNGTDPGDRFHEFMVRLEEMCDIVAEQLMERFDTQAKTKAYQYPLLMSGLYMGSENLKPEMEIAEVIRHGTLSIGFVGLAEALYALMRYHHAEDKMAQEFGLRAVELIHDKCKMYTDKWGLNFAAFATPAESVAGKLEKITEQKYGKIPGVTDRDYFTNSNHVPVWYHCTPSEKAAIEGPYHKLTTGGHIFYVEADADIVKNPKAVDDVNRLAWKNDMGYNAINHTTARCPQCNHEYNGPASEAPSKCPVCGAKMDMLARITGYISTISSKWNMGKKAELKDRVTHL